MRKLATTLLLAALPLTASAAVFDDWFADYARLNEGLPTQPATGNFVFDSVYTANTDVTVNFDLSYINYKNTEVLKPAGQYKYEVQASLWLVYADGTQVEIFDESKWTSGVTYNNVGLGGGPAAVIDYDKKALLGSPINFAAGTDFYFVLKVDGVDYKGTATLEDYLGGFPGQSATLIGFDFSGKGTFDDYVFRMSYASGGVSLTVPEPETYAMLLAGLGVVGAVVRRRKK